MGLEFSSDWTSKNVAIWGEVLSPFVGREVNGLELGSHEGRSAVWFLQNILTHEKSKLICVDGWWNRDAERRFDRNILAIDAGARLDKRRGDTHRMLRSMQDRVSFVYVDADHQAKSCLTDAILAWPLLERGGVLIFDDYQWVQPDPQRLPPKTGIDAFLSLWKSELIELHCGYQAIVKKR